jgi:Big-like domain-containing protein
MERAIFVMRSGLTLAMYALWCMGPLSNPAFAQGSVAWPQWGQNPQHTGALAVAGQALQAKLSDQVFDPFTAQEMAESGGALLMHYQVPLVNGSNVFMEFKTGTYVSCNPPGSKQPAPCGPNDWNTEIWNETDLQWQNGQLAAVWNFVSDWKPVPNDNALGGWEPLFQPVLAGQYIYVPGAGGTIYQLNQSTGMVASQINAFGTTVDPTKFVAGPLSADAAGNIYYNALQLKITSPWKSDVVNSWIVKVAPDGTTNTATYASLLPGAATSCLGTFFGNPFPWPPSQNAVPPSVKCGSQRSALNVAPAISADGTTLYTISRAHSWPRYAYLLALNTSDLSLQWSKSLVGILNDGCNVLLPPDGQPDGCSSYGTTGLDPTQNTMGPGVISDQASASPVVAPDASILLGVNDAYNYGRGHLLKFSSTGTYLTSYSFGWDTTPAIYPHDGTYSVILKDNHYNNGSYCSDPTWCPKADPGPYYITQLDSNLIPQWQYQDVTINNQHPYGREWCANAAAVDMNGVVYADDEDGYLYAVRQGGTPVQRIFLEHSISAGYTPTSIGGDGTIYTENGGHFIAIGNLFTTATAIQSSQNPSTYGTSVTFTATLTSSAGTPTGKVTFTTGKKALGTGTLNGGTATYTTAATQLPAGTYSITAAYGGDASHAGSTSSPLTQIVNKAATTTTLGSAPNPSTVNQSVTLSATVAAGGGLPTPTGRVRFNNGRTVLGAVTLSNGMAVLNTTFTAAGSYTLSATYLGVGNYSGSSGTAVQVVQ